MTLKTGRNDPQNDPQGVTENVRIIFARRVTAATFFAAPVSAGHYPVNQPLPGASLMSSPLPTSFAACGPWPGWTRPIRCCFSPFIRPTR